MAVDTRDFYCNQLPAENLWEPTTAAAAINSSQLNCKIPNQAQNSGPGIFGSVTSGSFLNKIKENKNTIFILLIILIALITLYYFL